jgi:hypothetical protein
MNSNGVNPTGSSRDSWAYPQEQVEETSSLQGLGTRMINLFTPHDDRRTVTTTYASTAPRPVEGQTVTRTFTPGVSTTTTVYRPQVIPPSQIPLSTETRTVTVLSPHTKETTTTTRTTYLH